MISNYNDYSDHDNSYRDPESDGNGRHDRHGDEMPQGSGNGSHAMRTASFALALAAVFSCSMIIVSVPLASLSIILALLSRGKPKRTDSVKVIIICDACAIIASAAITGYSYYTVMNSPILKQQFDDMINYYERLYGIDSGEDSDITDLFGGDGDDSSGNPDNSSGSGDDYYKRYYENETNQDVTEEDSGENSDGSENFEVSPYGSGDSDNLPDEDYIYTYPSGGDYI